MMRVQTRVVGGEVRGEQHGLRTSLARREGVVLTITDGEGITGTGEASPLPGYSPDTLADAHAALTRWRPPVLDPEAVPEALLAQASAAVSTPSARFAIEAAVLDWLGRRRNVPAHRLLAVAGGSPSVSVGHLLPFSGAVGSARELRAHGVRHLKLKVGRDVAAEIELLRALRAAVPDAELRVDANGLLPVDRVVGICVGYASVGVALLEEPCAVDALVALPRLPVPVALDESLAAGHAHERITVVARTQPLAAVVLKPTLLGGITRCLALARAASAVGAEPIVTHTFDGPVAMAAAAELALALPGTRVAGLGRHDCLSAYPRWWAAALGEVVLIRHAMAGLGVRDDA